MRPGCSLIFGFRCGFVGFQPLQPKTSVLAWEHAVYQHKCPEVCLCSSGSHSCARKHTPKPQTVPPPVTVSVASLVTDAAQIIQFKKNAPH